MYLHVLFFLFLFFYSHALIIFNHNNTPSFLQQYLFFSLMMSSLVQGQDIL